MYRSEHVSKLYDVARQTVSVWAGEFSEYLSPTANPGKRKRRLFSQEDMEVFDLVAKLKDQHLTNEEIHLQLKVGERGVAPSIQPNEVQAIVSGEAESRLSLEVERLQYELVHTRNELQKANEQLAEINTVKNENIRLEVELRVAKEDQKRLDDRARELIERLEAVSLQAGKQYAEGYKDGLTIKSDE